MLGSNVLTSTCDTIDKKCIWSHASKSTSQGGGGGGVSTVPPTVTLISRLLGINLHS